MKSPDIPNHSDCSAWVSFQGINLISNEEYKAYVKQCEENKEDWAVQLLSGVQRVNDFVAFWKAHIDLVGKRENGGLSKVCLQIPNALAITKEHCSFTLQNCCVSSMRARPCFEIVSTRFANECIYVHHSLLQRCQFLWALYHLPSILSTFVQSFQRSVTTTNLSGMCSEFSSSTEKKSLCDFMVLVMEGVHAIFNDENFFQP